MSVSVDISADRRFAGLDRRRLMRQARCACALLGVQSGELSIRLADDGEMAALHARHKGMSGPTDVLTFDFREEPGSPESAPRLEAEIVIGAQVAQRLAVQHGHATGDEAMLYVVHGLLHCLGFDDHTPAEAKAMHRREDEILGALGLGSVYHSNATHARRRRRL